MRGQRDFHSAPSEKEPCILVDEPAFIIQPDEMRAYKELRLLIDQQFINCKPFWSVENVYSEIATSPEGVDMYLRSTFFPTLGGRGSNQLSYASQNDDQALTVSSAVNYDREKTANRLSRTKVKPHQRESRQKDRTESRFLALLFAAVYDINTKKCSLLREIPPLRVFKEDKNGKRRRVSNFTEVRAFLRNKMMTSISMHAIATRTMFDLGPEHIILLPIITISIARTFLPFYYFLNDDARDAQENLDKGKQAVSMCLQSVCDFIKNWERRNYTSDVELSCSLQANRSHALYNATENLLITMIKVLPPSDPTIDHFKKGVIYKHGLVGSNECKPGKYKSCAVCDLSNHNSRALQGALKVGASFTAATAAREYVEALSKCISLQPPALRTLNSNVSKQSNRAPIWKCILSTVSVHRLQSLSRETDTKYRKKPNQARVAEFIEAVRWDVARMWIALDTTTKDVLSYMEDMKIDGQEKTLQAITDIVLGTTLSTKALFEETEKVKSALQSLCYKRVENDAVDVPHADWSMEGRPQNGNQQTSDRSEETRNRVSLKTQPFTTHIYEGSDRKMVLNKASDCHRTGMGHVENKKLNEGQHHVRIQDSALLPLKKHRKRWSSS